MSDAGSVDTLWSALRYGRLLPSAGASQAAGRAYAALVGLVEFIRDPGRRRVACRRVERWIGCSSAEARRTFRAALVSEAHEEADSVYFANHEAALQRLLTTRTLVRAVDAADARPMGGATREGAGTLFATLHFGSPILGYLALRPALGADCTLVARPLDAANPMPAAKLAYAAVKVAWVERVSGEAFLGTDGPSVARARERLLAGRDLFTPIDVPGDVVGRRTTVSFFGERMLFASGAMTLARLAGATVRPIVARRVGEGLALEVGRAIAPGEDAATLAAGLDELAAFIRATPGEWWMWPYLRTA